MPTARTSGTAQKFLRLDQRPRFQSGAGVSSDVDASTLIAVYSPEDTARTAFKLERPSDNARGCHEIASTFAPGHFGLRCRPTTCLRGTIVSHHSSAVVILCLRALFSAGDEAGRLNFKFMLLVAALLAVASTAVGASRSLSAPPRQRVSVRPIDSSVPNLNGAVALATLVAVGPASRFAEFRISCGWYFAPRRRVRAGLWKVDLSSVEFDLNTAPGKAYGYDRVVQLKDWERFAKRYGWSGTLTLKRYGASISNAGTTDICHGVLG